MEKGMSQAMNDANLTGVQRAFYQRIKACQSMLGDDYAVITAMGELSRQQSYVFMVEPDQVQFVLRNSHAQNKADQHYIYDSTHHELTLNKSPKNETFIPELLRYFDKVSQDIRSGKSACYGLEKETVS